MFGLVAVSNGGGHYQYVQQEAEVGEWLGQGAERLGLVGEVGEREFRELRHGIDPKTGEALRKEQVDRVYQKPWGEKTYKAREFFEVTLSAPKSVSMMGVMDPGVVEAHNLAVEQLLKDIEQATKGELVMAAWQHRSSRAGDPQLHTHIAVLNVMYDEKEWHGLRAGPIFKNQTEFTEAYRATLLGGIEKYGYQIEYPEIKGISEALREKYSSRAQQIDEKIAEFQEAYRADPNHTQVKLMVRQTADQKVARTAREIMAEQYARYEPGERKVLETLQAEARERQALGVKPENPVEKQIEQRQALKAPALKQDMNFSPAAPRYHWDYGEEKKQGHGMHQ